MSGELRLDPRVEEILREMAVDPRSSLLRVERRRVRRELGEREPRVSGTASGFSSAERELLRAHRAEAAWLLKEICKERLANEERSRLYLSRYIDAEHEVEILEPAEQRLRARELRELDLPLVQDPLHELDVFGLLERATAGPGESRPSVAQLALASLRLEPEDSTRICLGLDLVFSAQARSALGLYERVLEGEPGSLLGSMAWANAAFAWYRLGELGQCLACHEAAASISPERGPSAWRWMWMALRLGDRPAAERAAGELREEAERDRRWLDAELASLSARVRLGEVMLDPKDARLAAELLPAADRGIRSLLDEAFP